VSEKDTPEKANTLETDQTKKTMFAAILLVTRKQKTLLNGLLFLFFILYSLFLILP